MAIAQSTRMFTTGNTVPITRSNGIKYRKGDNQANASAAGHRRAVRSRRSAASASRPVVALARPANSPDAPRRCGRRSQARWDEPVTMLFGVGTEQANHLTDGDSK